MSIITWKNGELSCDSMVSTGDHVDTNAILGEKITEIKSPYTENDELIYQKILTAGVGNLANVQELHYYFKMRLGEKHSENFSPYTQIYYKICERNISVMMREYKDLIEDCCYLVVMENSMLLFSHSIFPLNLNKQKCFAMGSGEKYAYGAMGNGATAEEAAKIACHYDMNCGGEIKTYSIY